MDGALPWTAAAGLEDGDEILGARVSSAPARARGEGVDDGEDNSVLSEACRGPRQRRDGGNPNLGVWIARSREREGG